MTITQDLTRVCILYSVFRVLNSRRDGHLIGFPCIRDAVSVLLHIRIGVPIGGTDDAFANLHGIFIGQR